MADLVAIMVEWVAAAGFTRDRHEQLARRHVTVQHVRRHHVPAAYHEDQCDAAGTHPRELPHEASLGARQLQLSHAFRSASGSNGEPPEYQPGALHSSK